MLGVSDPLASKAVLDRHNTRVRGSGKVPILFAHGYGCDQSMWRWVMPAFEDHFRTVAFDYVGCGGSAAPYDAGRYASLSGYADDLLDVCRALGDAPVVLVGHSVSAMIGVLAAAREPGRFSRLVMIGPSPRYISDGDYVGGFSPSDIQSLLDLMEADHQGWAASLASTVLGNPDRPELVAELEASFCRMDPAIARQFARTTFLSDNRADLDAVSVPVLVLQCSDDVIAPVDVGRYVDRRLRDSRFVQLNAVGHCPHISAPEELVAAIRPFLADLVEADRADS
ncbi:sigma factor SigB regulation protein RsbQ [Allostella sp. ATCC 35155]|nr:sigma factor SigB regulation protein RsbQ [Stella sp. ATCC 35155]